MYDVNIAPQTQEEFEILINAKLADETGNAEANPEYTPKTLEQLEQEYGSLKPIQVPDLPFPVEPELAFEDWKSMKLHDLDAAFELACETATVLAPGGWPADANEVAYRNVQGLLITMENTGIASVAFCDAENNFQSVTHEDLKEIQQLIISKGQSLYQQKWALRTAINAADTREALDAVHISFS